MGGQHGVRHCRNTAGNAPVDSGEPEILDMG